MLKYDFTGTYVIVYSLNMYGQYSVTPHLSNLCMHFFDMIREFKGVKGWKGFCTCTVYYLLSNSYVFYFYFMSALRVLLIPELI